MSDSENTFIAFLAGAACGAAAGILFAPDSGENTRKRIKEAADDVLADLEEEFEKNNISRQELENESEELISKLSNVKK
jgi:gas vesicle protein